MRVGIHADALMHSIPGGIGTYVAGLVDHLSSAPDRDEFVLLLAKGPRPGLHWPVPPQVEQAALPVKALYPAWNYLRRPRVRTSVDVVHATAMVLPPARGAALVATIHDLAVERFPEVVPTPWRQLYRQGQRRAVKEAAVICANSASTRDELVDHYGIDLERIVVTPLAGAVGPASPRDEALLERLGLLSPFFLHVGTLEPRKNQVALIEAFAAAAGQLPEHRLVLAGAPGWDRGATTAAIDRCGLHDRVVLPGRVDDVQLATLYGAADAFIFPSRYEGFGIPLLEAMSFGLPCVAGDVPALREVAGDAALLVAPDDTDRLAERLVTVATDATLRSRLAEKGRARAASFTWTATVAATRRAYEQAAASI